MKDAPFVEAAVPADSTDAAAKAARQRLQSVLTELNPAGGKTVPADGGKNKGQKKAKRQAKQKAAAAK